MRDAPARAHYSDVRPELSVQVLAEFIRQRPVLVREWELYSADKRTTRGLVPEARRFRDWPARPFRICEALWLRRGSGGGVRASRARFLVSLGIRAAMKRLDVPKPPSLKCGLWVAWLALLAGVLFTLWATISSSLSDVAFQWDLATIRTVLFLSVVMLLTPAFAGYWTGALMLVLAARRVRWARWILLIGALFRWRRAAR